MYFWEVTEEDPSQLRGAADTLGAGGRRAGWKPHGRLLAVVANAHEGPLTDMCYLPHGDFHHAVSSKEAQTTARESEEEEWGRLATCGGEGTLRLWGVIGEGNSPLQLLLTVDVSNRGVGIGHARSVSWDRSGTTLAIGTVKNAVCLVQPGEVRSQQGKRPGVCHGIIGQA